MTNYAMVIDINKCNGCYNCFLSCKDEYSGNDYPPCSLALPESAKPWMVVKEVERGQCPKVKVDFVPIPCLQCAQPACIEKSPPGAVYMRPDGIVIIDPQKAKGRQEVVNSCPHRLITWNEVRDIPQKCTFCAHLLDAGWKAPRCVEACPSGALVFGDLDDPDSAVSELMASGDVEALSPAFNLDPKVVYRSLPKKMITGEVVLSDRPDTCAAGVTVTLNGDAFTRTVDTNYMGDFEFDGLGSRLTYTLSVSHAGYKGREMLVKTDTDLDMGEIFLEPIGNP
jgi:Fe-S-cluster-containing dehydrogenase component